MKITSKNQYTAEKERKELAIFLSSIIERGCAAQVPYKPNENDHSYWTLDLTNNLKVKFDDNYPNQFELVSRYGCSKSNALAVWLTSMYGFQYANSYEGYAVVSINGGNLITRVVDRVAWDWINSPAPEFNNQPVVTEIPPDSVKADVLAHFGDDIQPGDELCHTAKANYKMTRIQYTRPRLADGTSLTFYDLASFESFRKTNPQVTIVGIYQMLA